MILLYIIIALAWAICIMYCAALALLADMKNPALFLKHRLWDATSNMDEAYGKHKKPFTYSFLFVVIMSAPALYSLLKIVEYFR